MNDAVADDGGGDGGEWPGAVVAMIGWGDGKLGVPLNLPLHPQTWEADRRRWECVLGMSAEWMGGGCGGSFHPGARMVTDEIWGLGWGGGDEEAGGEMVWRDGHADVLLVD